MFTLSLYSLMLTLLIRLCYHHPNIYPPSPLHHLPQSARPHQYYGPISIYYLASDGAGQSLLTVLINP